MVFYYTAWFWAAFSRKMKVCWFESWSLFPVVQVGLIKDATPAKGLKCPYLI